MTGKTWTLTDEDGNEPTGEETALFCKWLTHGTHRPTVNVKSNVHGTRFRFTETDQPTFAMAEAAAQRHMNRASDMAAFIETVKLSVKAKDWKAVKALFKGLKKV